MSESSTSAARRPSPASSVRTLESVGFVASHIISSSSTPSTATRDGMSILSLRQAVRTLIASRSVAPRTAAGFGKDARKSSSGPRSWRQTTGAASFGASPSEKPASRSSDQFVGEGVGMKAYVLNFDLERKCSAAVFPTARSSFLRRA